MFVHHKDELPDVFHLKPLNNQCTYKYEHSSTVIGIPSKQTNLVHNCNQCNRHSFRVDSDNEEALGPRMRKLWRLKRPKLLVLLVGLLCFVVGLALPFIYIATKSSEEQPSTFLSSFTRLSHSPLLSAQHKIGDHLLQNVFISIKTTRKYHYPRLIVQLETWVNLVKSQTWFFTDDFDANLMDRTNGHLIRTNCSDSHSRVALACKMGAEFDAFLKSHKPWWCHFDDDNYVHVLRLSHLLQSHSPDQPVYLGKPSTARPIEIWDINAPQNVSQFWFATGGAGFCVSRTLALKMAPYAANGKLVRTGEEFWFPDDVTLGYIIEHLLHHKMTQVSGFHSHLEPMRSVQDLDEQISLSYSEDNVITLAGPFSPEVDPTRFYSLHCHLYGGSYCPNQK